MTATDKAKSQRKIPVIATIIALIAVVIMSSLGVWQLNRAEQKDLRLKQIEDRKNAAILSLEALLDLKGDIRDFPFQVEALLVTENVFLLDNRIHKGQVGYQVLVPARTNAGVMLVNFGWIKGGRSRQELPVVVLPEGPVQLHGMASVPQLNPVIRETAVKDAVWPKVIQQVDISLLSVFFGEPLIDSVMLLSPEHPRGYVRNWQPVVMPPEKHLAYAVQWFGLAIACILVYVFALRGRKKETHE